MKKIGWDDQSVKSGNKDARFKLEAGRVDVVRILGKCRVIARHWIEEKQRNVPCSMDTAGKCPACKAGYKVDKKYAATIMHIGVMKKDGFERVGKLKVWIFSPTTYGNIREVNDEYGDVNKLNLRITCSDTKFQRIGGIMVTTKAKMDKEMIEEAKESKGFIDDYLKPMSPKEIAKMLEGDSKEQEDLSLEDEEEPKKKKKSDEDEDEDDESDDEDDEDEDDDEDEEDEDDEEEVNSKKKKKKKSKDDEDDDEFEDLLDE